MVQGHFLCCRPNVPACRLVLEAVLLPDVGQELVVEPWGGRCDSMSYHCVVGGGGGKPGRGMDSRGGPQDECKVMLLVL